jgi:lipoate-protein ligase A
MGNPAFNMAMDEALLESAATLDSAILRFYGWSEPAASFGYFQRYAEVERLTDLRPLVRRPTGGGLVPHDHDWTYSLVFPPSHEWYALAAIESYRQVHEWIQRAFSQLKIESNLAPAANKVEAGQCFAGHEKSDLLWHGKKIAGAAQRRTKQGLLIQGSVQPPPLQLARSDWENAMIESAQFSPPPAWKTLAPDDKLSKRVEELSSQKYSQLAYNQKR